MLANIDTDRFPEWQPFIDAGTWCEAWTVRDIVIHQAGNAEELGRVLGAHLAGEPVATRSFEEREGPLRAMNEPDPVGSPASEHGDAERSRRSGR